MQFRTLLSTASAAVLALGMMAGAAHAGNNQLFVEQVGSNNYLDSNQERFNNETHATQTGSYNTGNASMIANSGNSNNNKALLQQNGNRNSGGWR